MYTIISIIIITIIIIIIIIIIKGKWTLISLSSLACGKFIFLCMCAQSFSFACANDTKIVRSGRAQCNSEESPQQTWHKVVRAKENNVIFR